MTATTIRRRAMAAMVVLAGLQTLDVATTQAALAAGHTEDNPLLAGFAHNVAALAAVKAAVMVVLLLLVRRRPTAAVASALWAIVGFYIFAVVGNLAATA